MAWMMLTVLVVCITEMQGQESRKANMLGFENDLSNEAAELLLDEDAQLVSERIERVRKDVMLTRNCMIGFHRVSACSDREQ